MDEDFGFQLKPGIFPIHNEHKVVRLLAGNIFHIFQRAVEETPFPIGLPELVALTVDTIPIEDNWCGVSQHSCAQSGATEAVVPMAAVDENVEKAGIWLYGMPEDAPRFEVNVKMDRPGLIKQVRWSKGGGSDSDR